MMMIIDGKLFFNVFFIFFGQASKMYVFFLGSGGDGGGYFMAVK